MRIGKIASLSMLLVSILFVFCSCDLSRKERRHPVFQRGMKLKKDGKYQAAAAAFREYLLINPTSIKTHQQLAELYHDHLNDPFLTVYHYRQYLRHAPESEENKHVKTWLKASEAEFYQKLHGKYGDKTEIDSLTRQLIKIRDQNMKLKKYVIYLRRKNQTLEQRLKPKDQVVITEDVSQTSPEETKKQKDEPEAPPAKSEKPKEKPKEKTAAATTEDRYKKLITESSKEQKKEDASEFYVVVEGDTLMGISQKVYGTNKYYTHIFEANRHILPSISKIQPGQRLKIPRIAGLKQKKTNKKK